MKKSAFTSGLSVIIVLAILLTMIPSIFVGAEDTNIDDFDLQMFVADIWADPDKNDIDIGGTTSYSKIQSYINDFESPAQFCVDSLDSNTAFKNSVVAWKLLTFQNVSDDTLDERGYYTAILFSILKVTTEDNNFLDSLTSGASKDTVTLTKSLMNFLKIKENLTYEQFISDTYTDEFRKGIMTEWSELWIGDQWYSKVGDIAGVLADWQKTMKNLDEFIDKTAKYKQLLDMSEDVLAVLDGLIANCPSENSIMKTALEDVRYACEGGFENTLILGKELFLQIGSFVLDEAIEALWKGLLTHIGGTLSGGVLIGQAIGRIISNALFSTDATIEQFYKLKALTEFETVVTNTVESLRLNYLSDKNNFSACTYIKSVQMMFSTFDLSGAYALEFGKTINEGSIVGVFFKSGYEDFKIVMSGKQKISQMSYEFINTMWKAELGKNYPRVYAELLGSLDNKGFIVPVNQKTTVPTGYVGIYTAQDLNNIRNNLSGNYILMDNIDLSSWGNWIPIGTSNQPFRGSVDGNGFSVKNLRVNITSGGTTYAGLFGYVQSATFCNLLLNNTDIKSKPNSNYVWGSTIYTYAGGIVGFATGNGIKFDNCVVSGNINILTTEYNDNCSGGLVGGISSSTSAIIENCKNLSVVSTNGGTAFAYSYAGGLVGLINSSTVHINNSYNANEVTVPLSYQSYSGGLIAYATGGTISINKSYNTGYVNSTTSHNSCYSGGFIACNYSTITIESSYNMGDVRSYLGDVLRTSSGGGFIGYCSSKATIQNCYNAGNIIATSVSNSNNTHYLGSLCGYLSSTSVLSNCYYLLGVVPFTNNSTATQTNVTALTTQQMKQQSSFSGFDFDATWRIDLNVNDNYPYLRKLLYSYDPSKNAGTIPFLVLDITSTMVIKGQSTLLAAYLYPHDAMEDNIATWSTSNSNVATVNNGVVTAKNSGMAIITAKLGNLETHCIVTVTNPLDSITLNKTETTLNKGQTENLTVSFNPTDTTDDTTVTWTTSDSNVTTVDNGVITAKNSGTAIITAKIGDKEAICIVTVTNPLDSIALNKTETTLNKGQTENLTVSYNPTDTTDDTTVTWTTSDSNVATVDNGVITAKNSGMTVITAKVGNKTATCTVTVNDIINAQKPMITAQPQGGTYIQNAIAATLSVTANITDNGTLSYQWYNNTTNSTTDGTLISGATARTYTPPTSTIGKRYYYVVVTNTNDSVNGTKTALETSNVATITVNVNAYEITVNGTPTRQTGLNFTVTNSSGNSKNATLIMAVYDTRGKLVKYEKKETLLSNDNNNLSFTLNTIPSGMYTVKIFCWDTTMMPLSYPESFIFN